MRHGETDANVQHITQGWLDTELNANGRQQAMIAAESFHETIEAIYSSDLLRAKQTAEPFRKQLPTVPYCEDARLRERNFGDATGLPNTGDDWDKFWSAPDDKPPICGAESLNQYTTRVRAFLDEIRTTHYKKVLLITHSGTINRIRDIVHGDEHIQHTNGSTLHIRL